MNNWLIKNKQISAVASIALLVGGLAGFLLAGSSGDGGGGEQKPLYWWDPMMPDYKSDKPGKSPMGMDMVPVYADDVAASDEAGVVKISPAVVNNLGVRTAAVEYGNLPLEIHTVGYVSFNEDSLTHIHTRVDGWIEHLSIVTTGDMVDKGQKLFDLYSPELVTAQREYLTAKATGNQSLRQAAQQKLKALGVHHGQDQIMRQMDTPQQTLGFFADRGGYVAELNVREGMFVTPMNTIMSIGSLDSVWVIAEIFERQSAWVKVGQTVTMRLAAFPGESWQGQLDYVYPVVDPKTRTLRARIVFANPDHRIKPNMFAELAIHAEPRKDTLHIPREAVIRDGRLERVVKVLGNGRFKSTAVKTGVEAGERVEIVQGLQPDDQVVVSAQFLIDSESSITADLSRIEGSVDDSAGESSPQRVWAKGTVKALSDDRRTATIAHAAIEAWKWPAMTMDFAFGDGVDTSGLAAGQSIEFCLERTDNDQYLITSIDSIVVDQPDDNMPAQEHHHD